ncbi:uncharacterized protein A4U43_UnF10690 [Asparagus officinalis]|uniref:RING-type domain-containing protein n=1 Tax=Asparagus officinalis TaxID=4686 RepID=A0A1R3L5E5_ASPOF|nr:uncharacterized protein A4U43_UnF10690 [Asparagus officinalis]
MTALRLSRNRCGICGEGVRSSVGAVFTAECSHAFHFPCISSRVRTQGCLVCPVCSVTWNDAPLLASSLQPPSPSPSPSPPAAPRPSASVPARRHRGRHSTRRDGERTSLGGSGGGGGGASINPKIYDDDESLQPSPTSQVADGLLQFNPIPEELEAEDGDKGDGDDDGIKAALTVVQDSLALVSTSRNHLTYVVSIKVKAPPLTPRPQSIAAAAPTLPVMIPHSLLDHPSCRPPIDLVTVLDVSGNMTATKLQMLKRAMRLVISSLGPGDRLSIVAFSVAAAKRLFPLRRMSRTGQRSARQIVDRLVICGTTQAQAQAQAQGDCSSASCMGDALRKATKVLEDRRERNPIATIMLLSDVQRQGHDQQKQQNVHATTPRR